MKLDYSSNVNTTNVVEYSQCYTVTICRYPVVINDAQNELAMYSPGDSSALCN